VIGKGGVSIDDILAAATPSLPDIFDDEHAPLAIRYSSGTTGRPKKTIATQRGQAFVYQTLSTELRISSDDIHLATGSLAHAALQVGLSQLSVGGSVVVTPFNKETLWEDCERHGATNLMLMPTMLALALEHPGQIERPITVCTMGATLPLPSKRRLMDRFKQVRLYDIYASTELGFITSLRPGDQARKPTSSGRPYFGIEIGIFDDDGTPTPAGEIGNIFGRGPMCVVGFVGSARPVPAPDNLASEAWIRSGDLGRVDEEGYLHISDRRDDLILTDGQRVFPSRVEAVIREFDGVREVAVIGVADERLGQKVAAYIEGRAPVEQIAERCNAMLAPHERPRAFHFVDSLPRTASAKISRFLVRQRVADETFPA
jgi:acyl-coenzyme A synthetase/AMP-(fatty) acid ligase